MDQTLREEIKQNLRDSLRTYVSNFVYKSTQPLDLLIPKERKIRSLVGGLETSMGTTVWEPVAKTLAKMNGFEIIHEKILMPHPFPENLAIVLNSLVTKRESKTTWIPIGECIKQLKEVAGSLDRTHVEYVKPSSGTGADIRMKKAGKEYAFDTKTVQPNVGDIKKFNRELMEWYAYRIYQDPDIDLTCQIAYPYNPYHGDFWLKGQNSTGILQPHVDAIVADEFWDFLSGLPHTYQLITNIFIELNNEGLGKELSELIEKMHTMSA